MANLETSITIALKIDIPESYPAGAMDEWIPVYSLLQEERQIAKGNLLTTIPSLAKEWYLSFQFKANKIDKGFRQVLHMTTGGKGAGSGAKYGERIPAIWIHDSKGFLISSATGGKNNKYVKPSWFAGERDGWVQIVVEQKLVGSEIVFSISIGGEGRKTLSVKNSSPSEFENVKVYSSSPWYTPANGNITSLLIATKQKGDYFMSDFSYFD